MTPVLPLILAAVGWPGGDPHLPDPNPGHLRVALVSIKSRWTDLPDPAEADAALRANVARHAYFVHQAAAAGAEFVGFPELSVNGYRFSADTFWLRPDGPALRPLRDAAARRRVYVAVGLAERDPAGRRWNTHAVIGPDGRLVGKHHKLTLTSETGFAEAGSVHTVVPVKGLMVGIATCADGTDRHNLEALARDGARLIYAPHASNGGRSRDGWYRWRANWAGPDGWIAGLRVHAALHNHAGLYNLDFDPPDRSPANPTWDGGAWFIGPDGKTLAQTPASTAPDDSTEAILTHNVPIPAR
ncbi:MAG: carbon-nitrogen hydrolase family protein [Gemmataceae bacterium]|nr:carbon-nitrogen hydrolase family protein [Gemmataceae bacterium]